MVECGKMEVNKVTIERPVKKIGEREFAVSDESTCFYQTYSM